MQIYNIIFKYKNIFNFMTTLETFRFLKENYGITAKLIAKGLNECGIKPKTARKFNTQIIYNVLHELSKDENVDNYINDLKVKYSNSTY